MLSNHSLNKQMNWFSGKGSQNQMFSEADKLNHSCYICYQQRIYDNKFTNTYKSFTDVHEYLEYEKTIPNDERRFHELIKGECVEYYDLDFKMEDWEGENKHLKIHNVLHEFIRVKNEFSFQNTVFGCRYEKDDLIVLESCGINKKGINKLSLHILVRPEINGKTPRYFKSIKDQKIIQTIFPQPLHSLGL